MFLERQRADVRFATEHTCPKCTFTEPCSKKYVHICGRCGFKWRTGVSPRELKSLQKRAKGF